MAQRKTFSVYFKTDHEDIPARLKMLAESLDRKVNYLVVQAILEYLDAEEVRLGIEGAPLDVTESEEREDTESKRVAAPPPILPPTRKVIAEGEPEPKKSVSSVPGHEDLDHSQRDFCEAPEGSVRLLAPAGCGKTLSLLFRCLHLQSLDQSRQAHFLIVTFTVAAMQELASRINQDSRFQSLRDHVEVLTLNSWGWRRVRSIAFNPRLVVSKKEYHFAMLNQLQPIWRKHPRVQQAIKAHRHTTPQKLMETIDSLKALGFDHTRHTSFETFSARLNELRALGLDWKLRDIWNVLTKLEVFESTLSRTKEEEAGASDRVAYQSFFRFWRDATQHLIDSATFTFEDQKYVAFIDEQSKLDKGSYLSGAARYTHVLVDEFQDINPLDLSLVKAIAGRSRATLTIVGDDDQAIFEWRGATPEYILQPEAYLDSQFDTYTLSVNYRSPRNVVELSQRLISHNTRRVPKDVRSAGGHAAGIEIVETSQLSDAMEAAYAEVQRVISAGGSPSRVALIGRKRAQIIPYQVFFASRNLPFCAAEDLQIFLSVAFNRVLKLMLIKERQTASRPSNQIADDVLALANLVKRYPLKKSEKQSLQAHLLQAVPSDLLGALDVLEEYRGPLKQRNRDGQVSKAMAAAMRSFLAANTVSNSLEELGKGFQGLQTDLGKAEEDIFFVAPPLLYLAEYARQYGKDYSGFVGAIEAAKAQLAYIPPFEDPDQLTSMDELRKRPIHLMTALRAKGKEFDSVILLDVNDGIWPSKLSNTPGKLEAERRVFYVAFTRARSHILMLVSRRFGNKEASPSPYISELGL